MRRTGQYGRLTSVNVEYPTASDLLQMVKNIPTKIQVLRYKSRDDGNWFGAFQVILSNGMSSPVFKANNVNDQNMQSFNIPDYSLVKRINGTKSCTICCLIFSKKDGTQIAKVETYAGKPYGTDSLIDDSEEIIGVYGHWSAGEFNNLGFIVWQPPQL